MHTALVQHPAESMAEAAGNSLSAQHPANYLTEPHKSWHLREMAALLCLTVSALWLASQTPGGCPATSSSAARHCRWSFWAVSQGGFPLRLTAELAPFVGGMRATARGVGKPEFRRVECNVLPAGTDSHLKWGQAECLRETHLGKSCGGRRGLSPEHTTHGMPQTPRCLGPSPGLYKPG